MKNKITGLLRYQFFRSLLLTLTLMILSLSSFASNIQSGRDIYQQNCLMCHGQNGRSTMATAANFKRGKGLFQSDFALLQRIKKGNKACPSYFGILKEQQIFDVIAYIRTLYR